MEEFHIEEQVMAYETILYSTDGPIATITLNRPEALNAIRGPLPHELEQAIHAAVGDQNVKVIVLRGAAARSAPARTSATTSHT